MSLIVCDGVEITFGATTVLSGLDLRIESRDRLAVVGANGAGKSSLLDVIAGVGTPSRGSVERDRRLRIGYLPQEAPEPTETTVLAEAMASRTDLAALRDELTALEQTMSAPGNAGLDAAMQRYGEAQHTYEALGGYDLEARARAALHGLGLEEAEQARSPRELSGGQVRRLEMSKLLLQDADLLLIDEPTNHLDLSGIEWLEDFLRESSTAMVLVSHDRRFLDRVCTRVLELSHGIPEEYPGNYSAYVKLRIERRARREKEWDAQQQHIAHQEEFIRRYKAGQRAKEARGRQTKLDRLDRVARPQEDRRPRLRLATTPGANVLMRATDVVAGYDGVGIVDLARAVIAPGDRVAIVGANGSGKSTLLHTLAGELPAVSGGVTPGARLSMRLYRQDLGRDEEAAIAAAAQGEPTVLDALLFDHPIGEERARTLLGSLLFSGDDVSKPLSALSGGERARLALGRLALEPTNLMLLDEPTNHLDIPAQEVLEDAVRDYPGGVILVSHDRALIDAVATRVWAIEDGHIREVLGNYSDLERARGRDGRLPDTLPTPVPSAAPKQQKRTPAPESKPPPAPQTKPAAATEARRDRARGRQHDASVRQLEQEIARVEAELAGARQRLLDPASFADPAAGAELGRQHDRLEGALAELYERWSKSA
ncbi:MAG TPA: ATP-binding cassette domain-containing protein [Candidatus Dormibacteraeota bacterium]|jgi:ATP-binding cassette subfamily F protein 3|nr:ATP-binding cassette domain-containing protein [Candidatus Dormibacteraeota bacterium]